MHALTLVVAGLTLAVVGASAQELNESALERQLPDPTSPSGSLKSQPIAIVDISLLPKAKQVQIHRRVAEKGEAELQKLRSAIEAVPSIVSALRAKQLSPTNVLSAETSPRGRLTLLIARR